MSAPRTASCRLSPAYPNAYLQADSALLVVKIAHPIEFFWEFPADFSFFPPLPPLSPHSTTQHKHQDELIAQLRQEAQQWKDQCLRLEETLRGEIKAWKDQFLRVDAEHTRLLNQLSATSSSSPVR